MLLQLYPVRNSFSPMIQVEPTLQGVQINYLEESQQILSIWRSQNYSHLFRRELKYFCNAVQLIINIDILLDQTFMHEPCVMTCNRYSTPQGGRAERPHII